MAGLLDMFDPSSAGYIDPTQMAMASQQGLASPAMPTPATPPMPNTLGAVNMSGPGAPVVPMPQNQMQQPQQPGLGGLAGLLGGGNAGGNGMDFSNLGVYSPNDKKLARSMALLQMGGAMLANNQGHGGAFGPAFGAGAQAFGSTYGNYMTQMPQMRLNMLQSQLGAQQLINKMNAQQQMQSYIKGLPAGQEPDMQKLAMLSMAADPSSIAPFLLAAQKSGAKLNSKLALSSIELSNVTNALNNYKQVLQGSSAADRMNPMSQKHAQIAAAYGAVQQQLHNLMASGHDVSALNGMLTDPTGFSLSGINTNNLMTQADQVTNMLGQMQQTHEQVASQSLGAHSAQPQPVQQANGYNATVNAPQQAGANGDNTANTGTVPNPFGGGQGGQQPAQAPAKPTFYRQGGVVYRKESDGSVYKLQDGRFVPAT